MAANEPILPSVARMAPGDHYCGIYRTDEDQRAFIIDYIREGARKNDKMFYIVNVQTAAQLKQTLASAGIDVDGLVEKGSWSSPPRKRPISARASSIRIR